LVGSLLGNSVGVEEGILVGSALGSGIFVGSSLGCTVITSVGGELPSDEGLLLALVGV
jgi:hypothetical protein